MKIKAWAVTDWGGGIKYPSVSIFDTEEEAIEGLKELEKLPDSLEEGEKNKVVKVLIKIIN